MKKLLESAWDGLTMLWGDYLLYLHCVLYVIAIIFLILGLMAAFTVAPGPGIFLIVLNTLLLVLMRKLDRAADARFNTEFDEMVRRNLEEQILTDGEQKQ